MTWGFFSAVRLIAARSRVCNKKWRMGGMWDIESTVR